MNASFHPLPLIVAWLVSWAQVAGAQTPAKLAVQLEGGQIKLSITGQVGQIYYLESTSSLGNPTTWIPFDYVKLPQSPYLYLDARPPTGGQRFYRARTSTVLPVPNMAFIPAGTFQMGSPPNDLGLFPEEGPRTSVTITRGFWMSKFEVTQAEYLAVKGNNPSDFQGDMNLPVDSVTWADATDYCAKLTQQERTAGRIPANNVYRLPTEAEWEYAGRAGTSTRFSYGDDPNYERLPDYAWFARNSAGKTHPVGQKLANPWGLFDMHGNVSEWCQDRYGRYPGGSLVDPTGPAQGPLRVVRGGSYYHFDLICRSAYRTGIDPTASHNNLGLRVVLASLP